MKLETLKKVVDSMQAGMVSLQPTLVVAKDTSEVIGIITLFPQLKSYVVSEEQFQRQALGKTWQGNIVFLDGEKNGTQKKIGKIGNSLCESEGRELSVSSQASGRSEGQESLGASGQHSGNIHQKQKLSKTGKK